MWKVDERRLKRQQAPGMYTLVYVVKLVKLDRDRDGKGQESSDEAEIRVQCSLW
jgi:hypothetical protein